MAGLLLWSGWPQRQFLSWALLSLRLVDAVLFLLPLVRPEVLTKPAYLPLARGVHEVYRLALVVLFGQGVSLRAWGESRGLSGLGCPLMMSSCMKIADGAQAYGEVLEDGTWRLEMEGRFTFTWKPRNFFEERILLVLLRQIRTPQSTAKRPFLRQEWLAELAQETGFAEVRRLLRQSFTFTADGPQWKDRVLVGRLFELNETLMARLQAGECLTPQLTLEANALQMAVGAPITPLKKPLPFVYRWQRALFGQWEEIDDAAVCCPHCGTTLVARKGNKPRPKKYRDPETRDLVRSRGVVGVEEKWVLVPKNDKPEGKRSRWMYVYLAVDVFTYDVPTRLALHIDIYPHNGKDEARAFLQALKARGYQLRVIVTDMNQDYTEPIHTVFPKAIHHECIFHALQGAQRLIKKVYGNRYAQTHPGAVLLKEQIYAVFQAKSRKTVNKRYRQVMALKEAYVAQEPDAQRIFDFLERHYPTLVNAVENPLVPKTTGQ
jgi:hypothetical protein